MKRGQVLEEFETSNTRFDYSTGEVLGHTTNRIYKKSFIGKKAKVDFQMSFKDFDLSRLIKGNTLSVFFAIVERMDTNNIIDLSSGFKRLVSSRMGDVHVSNISAYIKELVSKDLLRNIEEDYWMVNPEYKWKADLELRFEAIKKWQDLKDKKAPGQEQDEN